MCQEYKFKGVREGLVATHLFELSSSKKHPITKGKAGNYSKMFSRKQILGPFRNVTYQKRPELAKGILVAYLAL